MIRYWTAVLLMLVAIPVLSQDRATLELQRKKLLEEIKMTERILAETRSSVQSSMSDLFAIRKQISLRETLINTTQSEIRYYDNQIAENEREIKRLEDELEELREEYGEMIQTAYKHQRLNNRLYFVLSASSFNEAFRRMNYLRRIGDFRKEQAEEIKEKDRQVKERIAEISLKRKEKEVILAEQLSQKKQLDEERLLKDRIVAQLKSKEKQLNDDISKKQQEARKLNQKIEELIRKEIEAAETRDAKGNVSNTEVYKNTPEYINLSKNFASNKGKLPWPVEKGFISRPFGRYRHPELGKVEIENNGIDIRTEKGTKVRAVFEGKVIAIINNPVYKNAVLINHGEYFSVYTMLNEVFVRADQKVSTKEYIGKAYTDEDSGQTEVHLEIWKGQLKLDPALWIYND